MWIDALCINWGDIDEKSHQVRQVDRVYIPAKRVVVWLGLPTIVAKISDSRDICSRSVGVSRRYVYLKLCFCALKELTLHADMHVLMSTALD